MDIKPVPATSPPAPLFKVTARQDARRDPGGKQRLAQVPPHNQEPTDAGPHIDACA